ncbi:MULTISPECIES: PLD nuclease N-terminal domain-containing protein [unclassified Streptomyces]|uniref:PLD nuclease N-terminal domain-containing protein n=1 Tax=Streptomyces sp. NPDC007872 TaxID=3364782 RepID=UPI0036845134
MLRALLFILPLALMIYAFIDCLNTPEEEVKHLPKPVWAIVILLFSIVGAIGWIVAGKERGAGGRRGAFGARGAGGAGGWVAPDDNPEFLKSLADDGSGAKADDDALLKDWEADLRRREEELKRRERGEENEG